MCVCVCVGGGGLSEETMVVFLRLESTDRELKAACDGELFMDGSFHHTLRAGGG